MEYTETEIPRKVRKKRAAITGLVTLFVLALAILDQYSSDRLSEYWTYLLVIPVFGLLISSSFWFNRIKREPTEETKVELQKIESEKAKAQAEFEDRWYIRYALAGVYLVGGIYVADTKPNLWWVWIVGAILAAVQARELTILILIGGSAFLIFKGIASLPVSVAVVVGALIIAGAVRGK